MLKQPEEAPARLLQARILCRHRGVRRRAGDARRPRVLRPRQDRVRLRLPVRSGERHDVYARDACASSRASTCRRPTRKRSGTAISRQSPASSSRADAADCHSGRGRRLSRDLNTRVLVPCACDATVLPEVPAIHVLLSGMMSGGFIYIMSNRRNGTLYVGVTSDLVRRCYEHRNSLLRGFTKQYGLKKLGLF